jgi:hypothetical protein
MTDITDTELAAFEAHLVSEGIGTIGVRGLYKRGWRDMLENSDPDLFPAGEFEARLRKALEAFVDSRTWPPPVSEAERAAAENYFAGVEADRIRIAEMATSLIRGNRGL